MLSSDELVKKKQAQAGLELRLLWSIVYWSTTWATILPSWFKVSKVFFDPDGDKSVSKVSDKIIFVLFSVGGDRDNYEAQPWKA